MVARLTRDRLLLTNWAGQREEYLCLNSIALRKSQGCRWMKCEPKRRQKYARDYDAVVLLTLGTVA